MKKLLLLSLFITFHYFAFSQTVTSLNISASGSGTQILATNNSRGAFFLYNPSDTTIFIKFGSAITTDSIYSFPLCPGVMWKCSSTDCSYKGKVYGKSASGTKAILITEF